MATYKRDEIQKLSIADTFKRFSSSENGLSDSEAEKRLSKYGYNEIVEKKKSSATLFLSKFYGAIPFMVEAIMLITFIIHDYKDFYIITALLFFNAIMSFIEEKRADNSIELLKKRITVNARVLRNGSWRVLQAKYLTVGDVIRVRIGDIVPADAKIIDSDGIEIDQSVLTGESGAITKKAGDLAYSGSVVREGEATCVVVAVGYSTYYGYTAKLVQEARTQSHLEKAIIDITKYMVGVDAIVVAAMFAFGIYSLHLSLLVMIPFVLVVLIASVPVALPAAFTVTMALGTERLVKKDILVSRLDSIEELSNMDIICFDKTGTLTENRLEVKEIAPSKGHSIEEVMAAAALASRKEDNDPIDMAVLTYAADHHITPNYKVVKFTPFQPKTKMSSAIVAKGRERFEVTKGAFNTILSKCDIDTRERKALAKKLEEFSLNEYRTIAVASSEGGKYKLLGIVAMYDKPRNDAKRLVGELRSLGIKIKMLTGDNLQIAKEVAKEVGIGDNIGDMNILRNKSDKELEDAIDKYDGFAEIFPEDKYTIVKMLQKRGYRVGMTGDGVNDTPALKQAEVGIAVENATDVAKSVAGIVLAKNGIEILVNAVKESRRIFERMITYTIVKVSKVIQIVFFIALVFSLLKLIPILPFELILLIFTNDIVNIAIATDNSEYSSSPDVWDIKSISLSSLVLGTFLLVLSFAFIPAAHYMKLSTPEFQTFVFLMFVVVDQFLVYAVRSRGHMWKSRPSGALVLSSIIGVTFAVAFAYFGIFIHSISAYAILLVIVLSFMLMMLFDWAKIYAYKAFKVR